MNKELWDKIKELIKYSIKCEIEKEDIVNMIMELIDPIEPMQKETRLKIIKMIDDAKSN
jgi:hypothetical protein